MKFRVVFSSQVQRNRLCERSPPPVSLFTVSLLVLDLFKKSTKRRKEGQETGSSHRLLLMQSLENLAVCVCMPNELLHSKSQ